MYWNTFFLFHFLKSFKYHQFTMTTLVSKKSIVAKEKKHVLFQLTN